MSIYVQFNFHGIIWKWRGDMLLRVFLGILIASSTRIDVKSYSVDIGASNYEGCEVI